MFKLLIIADEWEMLERYEERLAGEFAVTTAPFGGEGVRVAREQSPPADLVLIHLGFEDMTAREAEDALLADARTRRIPRLLVHEEPGPEDRASPARRRALLATSSPDTRVLLRPFDIEELRVLIRAMISPPADVPELDELEVDADYRMDAAGRLEFTRAYHLKRGHCCRSGCKHCPFGYGGPAS